jgi:PAS domain S-box-containing protein
MRADASLPLPDGRSRASQLEALWDAPVGIAFFDRDQRVTRVNRALAEMNGLAVEGHVGRLVAELLPNPDPRIAEALERVLTTGEPVVNLEVAGETAKAPGLRRHWLASYYPVRSASGAIEGAGCVVIEVTQRRRSEEENRLLLAQLEAERRLLAEVLRQMPAGVVVRDAVQSGHVRTNDRLQRMLGREPRPELFAALDRGVLRADRTPYPPGEMPLARAVERGELVQGEELILVRDDGTVVVARVSASPVRDQDGHVFAGVAVLEDVSVRKRLEEEQHKLLSLLESSADFIAVASLDGRPLYFNEAALRLAGLHGREDGLSHPLESFVSEADAARAREEVLPQLLAGERWRGELSVRDFASAESVPVEVAAFCIGGAHGDRTAVAVVGRDIRSRKRAEAERQRLLEELEAKQSLLDAVLQQMPAGVMVAEAPSGNLLFSNEQAEQILRRALFPVEAGAPARLSVGMLPDGSSEGRAEWPLQRALRSGESITGDELEVVRGDGTRALLRCNAAPLRDRQGATVAAIAVFEDVTEEKRAERALLESEARFRRLAESGMIGVFFAERDAVTFANDAFLELLGMAREELLQSGLRWRELTPPEQVALDDRALQEVRERGVCRPFEKDFLRRDGTRVPALVGAAQLEEGRDGWVFFVLDNRERKRAEELQRQLMGIVSHDLRSPLTAVVMASAHFVYAEDMPARHVKTAARIHASAERMQRLIKDLLDYQQARVGRGIPIARRPCDLHKICAEVLAELSLLHPRRELRYEPHGEGKGNWDPDRLTQVLQNLLSNALQHGPHDEPTRLSWRPAEDGMVLLEVHNGGPPIPAEFTPHLFQPFRRARPVSDGSQGFGLGLFIVCEIVRAHGGTVAVRSVEGEGTTFTVRLPR